MSLLAPEKEWEGADCPVKASVRGAAPKRVHELRDPCIFEEEGKTYLLYSVAGEAGIAIGEINRKRPTAPRGLPRSRAAGGPACSGTGCEGHEAGETIGRGSLGKNETSSRADVACPARARLPGGPGRESPRVHRRLRPQRNLAAARGARRPFQNLRGHL